LSHEWLGREDRYKNYTNMYDINSGEKLPEKQEKVLFTVKFLASSSYVETKIIYYSIYSMLALLGGLASILYKVVGLIAYKINRKFFFNKIARAIYFKQILD